MRFFTITLLAMSMAALVGCNTLRIQVDDAPIGAVVDERHDYWVWGGFPSDLRVDLHQVCPAGTVAIEESIRPSDAAYTLLTLTIWSPRTATYHCRTEDV